jgi:hypothetical protein
MKPFFVLLACLVSITTLSQKTPTSVVGVVFDSTTKKTVGFTTVSLVQANDSSLVSFAVANEDGFFTLRGITKPGNYLLSASYIGYMPVWMPITIELNKQHNIGKLVLSNIKTLDEVVVKNRRPPVEMKNDTLEFNAENFKTQPNAVVEDLLKRLPGVTVDNDGTVRVNGQKINKVYVNGREFFGNDPKMATKNLDADAIDKVQLFDKKSDLAEFTGFDDGKSQKAINLKLKKDKSRSFFGRVMSGAGNKERWETQGNINKFNDKQQLSFIGMGNNINKQGFTLSDILNFTGELNRGIGNNSVNFRIGGNDLGLPVTGLGQNQQGVATTIAGGINYNDVYKNKTDFSSNVLISDTRLFTEKTTNRQNVLPNNAFIYLGNTTTQNNAQQQRFNLSIDTKLDSFHSIKFTPQFTLQQGSVESNNTFNSTNTSNIKINEGFISKVNATDGKNFSNTFLFRKKFRKKGRTLAANIEANYNDSRLNGFLKTSNTLYNPMTQSDVNQQNNKESKSYGITATTTFTEALNKRTLLQLSAYYNYSGGDVKRKVYDFNPASNTYSFFNTILSNAFVNKYIYGGGSFLLKQNRKKFTLSAGTSFQNALLISENRTIKNNIEQNFTDWLPQASIQYKVNSNASLSLNYNTSIQQPSANLLQPVPDISDPLNVFTGNPALKRTYNNSINLSYNIINIGRGFNLFAIGAYTIMNNAVIFEDALQSNGSRFTKPINANGVTMLFGNINTGITIKKLKSRLDFGLGYNNNKSAGIINGGYNSITNITYSPTFSWNLSVDKVIDITANARINYNQATYSLQPILNNSFVQQTYSLETTTYLFWKMNVRNTFNYIINSGRADGFNTNIPLWNISVAKSFLKNNRAELKFSINDVLNKNIGINRAVNATFIDDTQYNVLRQFFMLNFTYVLNKGGNKPSNTNVVIKTFGSSN